MKSHHWTVSAGVCVVIAVVAAVVWQSREPAGPKPGPIGNANTLDENAPDANAPGQESAADRWAIPAEPPKTEEEIGRILKNVRASIAVHQNGSTYCGPISKLFSQIDDPALIPVLSQQSDASDSWGVKLMCFYALSNMPGDASDEALRKSIRLVQPLYDPVRGEIDREDAGAKAGPGVDWMLRESYLMAVGKHLAERGKMEAVADLEQVWEVRPLSLFGKAGLEAILRIDANDNDEEPYSRDTIMGAIAACKHDDARPLLEKIAFDKDKKSYLRQGAMYALEHWGDDAADVILRVVASTEDGGVLRAALSVGRAVVPERTRAAILARLAKNEPKRSAVRGLLESLAQVGTREDVPVAESYLDAESDRLRMAAAKAIVLLGGELPKIRWDNPRKGKEFQEWLRIQKEGKAGR